MFKDTQLNRNNQQQQQDKQTSSPQNVQIFVHGLHPFTTEQDIIDTFRPHCLIQDLTFKRNHKTGKHRGYAFFTVPSKEIGIKLTKTDHILLGRRIHCDLRENDIGQLRKNQNKRVFIGGIPQTASDDELTLFFSQFGHVRAAYAIKDLHGGRKNYGFVDFKEETSAIQAVECSPVFIHEKKVDVKAYKKKNIQNKSKPRRTSRRKQVDRRVREPSYHSISSTTTQPNSQALQENSPVTSAPESTHSGQHSKTDFNYGIALPDFRNKVLGCFMNDKGSQIADLMRTYMTAMMNNDYVKAKICFEKVQVLKRQVFDGQYMSGLAMGISM